MKQSTKRPTKNKGTRSNVVDFVAYRAARTVLTCEQFLARVAVSAHGRSILMLVAGPGPDGVLPRGGRRTLQQWTDCTANIEGRA